MDADLLMAKRGTSSGIDLAVGEPVFLQEQMDPIYRATFGNAGLQNRKALAYPNLGGNQLLKDAILEFHQRVHGKSYNHVVVTTGAKQALLAALCAVQRLQGPHTSMHHPAPYWPSYPTMAALSGLQFNSDGFWDSSPEAVNVITSPNNPEGCEFFPAGGIPAVADCAYAHPIYGTNRIHDFAAASVWSAAKLFGVSGLRIGWMVTHTEAVADLAAEYVEKTTSGVNRFSQEWLARLLRISMTPDYDRVAVKARASLMANAKLFSRYLEEFLDDCGGVPVNHNGMFAWLKPMDTEKFNWALSKTEVRLIPGEACGGTEEWFRLNVGQSSLVLEMALAKIQKAMRA